MDSIKNKIWQFTDDRRRDENISGTASGKSESGIEDPRAEGKISTPLITFI